MLEFWLSLSEPASPLRHPLLVYTVVGLARATQHWQRQGCVHSISPSIPPSILCGMHPFIHLSIRPATHASTNPLVSPPVAPTYPSNRPSIRPQPAFHSAVLASLLPPALPSISIHPSIIQPTAHQSIPPSLYPSAFIPPYTYPSILPSIIEEEKVKVFLKTIKLLMPTSFLPYPSSRVPLHADAYDSFHPVVILPSSFCVCWQDCLHVHGACLLKGLDQLLLVSIHNPCVMRSGPVYLCGDCMVAVGHEQL